MYICCAGMFVTSLPQIIGGAMDKDFIHLWPCAMLVAGLMLVFKCMSADQARDSVEWPIYVSCRPFTHHVCTHLLLKLLQC